MINFRGHSDTTVKFDESFNVIIGKNDIGKSSVLDSLEIFFNNETVKIDIDDCNKKAVEKNIEIHVSFTITPEAKYTIDTIPTDLGKEFLLDRRGKLTVKKIWDCSKEKLTQSSLKTYIVANYPVGFESPLICEKITELKKILDTYSSRLDVAEVKKNTSSIIRQAIYKIADTESLLEIDIPIDKEDGKKIFDSLKSDFPMFFLFQADRQNKDSDKEVQDPLKAITKSAIYELADQLEAVQCQIKQKAEAIGLQTIEKLREMNSEIANILSPELTTKPWESLFSFSFVSDDGIPINKRGSGVRRLILLNYFRAEAERVSTSNSSVVYAIEEPETSQHPDWQVELFKALIELSEKDGVQVITTTHSPALAGLARPESIIFIYKEDGKPKVEIGNVGNLEQISKTLGVLPDISVNITDNTIKVILCVEGPTDVEFLENVSVHFGLDIKSNTGILAIPLGGGTLKHWVNRNYLRKLNKPEVHIYDSDVLSYKEAVEEINQRPNSRAFQTKCHEIENYIHPSLIKDLYSIDEDFVDLNSNWRPDWRVKDIPKELSEFLKKLKQNGNNKILKEGKDSIKALFSSVGSSKMTESLFREMEVYDEIAGWFNEVKKYI